MDPTQFDRLSRALATAANRRAAIVAVIIGLLPFIAPADEIEARKKKAQSKKQGRRDGRNGANRNGDRDRSRRRHPGRGKQNDAQSEKKRKKKKKKKAPQSPPAPPVSPPPGGSSPPPPPLTCQGGQTLCGQSCVDTATDRANCGGCGAACSPDQTCTGGQCTCNGTACDGCCDGTTCQAGTSPQRCGSNGAACQVCGGGSTRESGSCVCPDDELFCDGACIDKTTDANHCGSCGYTCEPGQVCKFGVCGITCGAEFCASFADESTCCAEDCVDTRNRTAHCGACGNDCRNRNATICIHGSCSCGFTGAPCGPDRTCCRYGQGLDAECRHTGSDIHNCGACDRNCGIEANQCVDGRCQCGNFPACELGKVCCGNGLCVFVEGNQNHCGACGNVCPNNALCIDGACQCAGDNSCTANKTCCGTSCYDLQTDERNCGGCGAVCDSGQKCCNGRCKEVKTDILNCGACGNICAGDPESTTSDIVCVEGRCGMTCRGQNYDYFGDVSDGCELEDRQTNHTQATAFDLGSIQCYDWEKIRFGGTLYSDKRVHTNPPAPGHNAASGAAELWFKVIGNSGICYSDAKATLWMEGGTTNCYKLGLSIVDSGGGSRNWYWATVVNNVAKIELESYERHRSGELVYITVSKVCASAAPEIVNFEVEFNM